MIERIVEDVRKKGSFSFEKIIENNNLSDEEFFEFLKFVYQGNIPEVRTSVDGNDFIILEDENYYVEEKETIKAYLENVKEKNEEVFDKTEKTAITDENKTEMIEKYLKIAVRESLLYSKYGFSFLDMVQEATLGVITALNYYDKISLMTEEIDFFIKNFAVKYILENIPKKLSYIDERILVMFYGLDDKIYSENEIAKTLNIAKHNVNILKEKALNKLSIDLLKNEFMKNREESEYTVN